MILPADDSLQLTSDDNGFIQPAGSIPLVIDKTNPAPGLTLNDYMSFLPAWARKGSSALRDAYLASWGQMCLALWARFSFVLEAQASPRWAESIWLDAIGDLLNRKRAPNEDDPTYRARLMIAIDVVSPNAIKAAVSAVFAKLYPNLIPQLLFAEPTLDSAYCSPASTSDPPDAFGHGSRQTITALPSWTFWTQPTAGTASLNQSIFLNQTLRFWGNDPTRTIGNLKYGAFAAPASAPQFWIILETALTDDSQSPYCHALTDLTPAYGQYDFTYGIAGLSTLHQSVIAPASTSGPYITPVPCVAFGSSSLFDQVASEVSLRRAAGVGWLFFEDLPTSKAF